MKTILMEKENYLWLADYRAEKSSGFGGYSVKYGFFYFFYFFFEKTD